MYELNKEGAQAARKADAGAEFVAHVNGINKRLGQQYIAHIENVRELQPA